MTRALLVLLLALFAAGGYLLVHDRFEQGKGLPDYSVYSDEPDALAQAARLLGKLGWQPVALTRPIQQTRHEGVVIVAEPGVRDVVGQRQPPSKTDVDAYLRWVENGNTLVLASAEMTPFHDALKVLLVGEQTEDVTYTAEPAMTGYTDGVTEIAVESRRTVRGAGGLPLWWVDGQPGAVLLGHGDGRVIVLADPSVLTHRGLRRADNAVFLYNLARLDADEGVVYFDEYHHGIRSGGGAWGYLRYHGQHWLILQLLAVAAVAVWGLAMRLGPAVPTPRTSAADAVAYASGLARIYQRAGTRQLLAGWLARDFLARLARHLRLPASTPAAALLAAWRKKHDADSAAALQPLLHAAASLRAPDSTPPADRELLQWAVDFDSFLRETRRDRMLER